MWVAWVWVTQAHSSIILCLPLAHQGCLASGSHWHHSCDCLRLSDASGQRYHMPVMSSKNITLKITWASRHLSLSNCQCLAMSTQILLHNMHMLLKNFSECTLVNFSALEAFRREMVHIQEQVKNVCKTKFEKIFQ
jgi:hypothetical protein